MKNFLLALAFIFVGTTLSAQNDTDYAELQKETLKVEKKALIADAMILTNDESEEFWPLYDEYNDAKLKIQEKFLENMKDYFERNTQITDHEATKLWNDKMELDNDLNKLEKKYFKKMIRNLPPVKIVRYFQAENKIDAMISAKFAMNVPLLGDLDI
ncbi:MAG: hypothetical protein KAH10_01925 [Flavobacteriales bacterium]|nr:hypothetical protein [Flavobacteriales bacterium]